MHWKDMLVALVFVAGVQAVGVLGALFTFESIPTWYAALQKPFFAPPNWIFGPVWTLLYFLIGIVGFWMWKLRHEDAHTRTALKWFGIQMFLNAIWTPIFFGLQMPGLALVVILLLLGAIVRFLYAVYAVRPLAAYLLVPYLLWVSFATLLNGSLWYLN